jgi:adenylate cyclase
LIEKLFAQGAEVITFDVHFIDPRSHDDDNSFADAMRKARNVVLAEPLTAREIAPGNSGNLTELHSIVKIVKPLPLLASSAVATAPFVLPRIPFKVNQYWTFQTGAGDLPTFPAVAFQLFSLPVYEEFVRLLGKVSPNQTGNLPRNAETITARGVVKWIRDLRGIFESEPLITERMLTELKKRGEEKVSGTFFFFD